jgi:parvulin-like peptidyl-prolyl isomerase
MNKLNRYGVAIALGLSVMIIGGVDRVMAETGLVAKVGSVQVTEQDVQREIEKRIPMQLSFHGGMKPEKLEKIRAEAKEVLINRAYKIQYALDNEIAVSAKAVDAEWMAAVAKTPQLVNIPAAQQEALKKELYLDLLAKQAEETVVNSKVSVSDEEIKRYYDNNRGQFLRSKLFKASHIFVKVDPAETAEEKAAKQQKAEKLFERAKAGEDFYNLAYYESDDRSRYVGGSLGSFHANQAIPEFSEVLQKMKPGEVAGPIKTLYGYHIVKLDDIQPEKQLSFEESAANIKERLTEEKRAKLYESWMAGLRQKYPLQTP